MSDNANESTDDEVFLSRINTRESSTLTFSTVAFSASLALLALESIANVSTSPTWLFSAIGFLFAFLGFTYREVTLEFTDWKEFKKLSARLQEKIEAGRETFPTFVRRFTVRLFLLLPMIAWTPNLVHGTQYVYLASILAFLIASYLSLIHLRSEHKPSQEVARGAGSKKADSSWKKSASKAVDYLFAVVAGNLLLSASAKPEQLFEIEGAVGAILVVVLALAVRSHWPSVTRLVKVILIGARWAAATFAGTLFGIAYTIVGLQWWPAGVLAIGLFFAIVVLGVRSIELLAELITARVTSDSGLLPA